MHFHAGQGNSCGIFYNYLLLVAFKRHSEFVRELRHSCIRKFCGITVLERRESRLFAADLTREKRLRKSLLLARLLESVAYLCIKIGHYKTFLPLSPYSMP